MLNIAEYGYEALPQRAEPRGTHAAQMHVHDTIPEAYVLTADMPGTGVAQLVPESTRTASTGCTQSTIDTRNNLNAVQVGVHQHH